MEFEVLPVGTVVSKDPAGTDHWGAVVSPVGVRRPEWVGRLMAGCFRD